MILDFTNDIILLKLKKLIFNKIIRSGEVYKDHMMQIII